MRAKENASHCGQFSKFTIRGPVISGIYSTDEKLLAENYTIFASKKKLQTEISLPNGRNRVMKIYAA
jgi:hypothetical protein